MRRRPRRSSESSGLGSRRGRARQTPPSPRPRLSHHPAVHATRTPVRDSVRDEHGRLECGCHNNIQVFTYQERAPRAPCDRRRGGLLPLLWRGLPLSGIRRAGENARPFATTPHVRATASGSASRHAVVAGLLATRPPDLPGTPPDHAAPRSGLAALAPVGGYAHRGRSRRPLAWDPRAPGPGTDRARSRGPGALEPLCPPPNPTSTAVE